MNKKDKTLTLKGWRDLSSNLNFSFKREWRHHTLQTIYARCLKNYNYQMMIMWLCLLKCDCLMMLWNGEKKNKYLMTLINFHLKKVEMFNVFPSCLLSVQFAVIMLIKIYMSDNSSGAFRNQVYEKKIHYQIWHILSVNLTVLLLTLKFPFMFKSVSNHHSSSNYTR